jgi:transcriptional regulator with XRE-family HTH domain
MTLLLGEKLRRLRLQNNLSISALARHLGAVKRAHVSNVEANRRPPSLHFVILVANYFGVTSDYLLRDTIPVDILPIPGRAQSSQQTTLPEQFGGKLHYLREQSGISQTELAKRLGLRGHARELSRKWSPRSFY